MFKFRRSPEPQIQLLIEKSNEVIRLQKEISAKKDLAMEIQEETIENYKKIVNILQGRLAHAQAQVEAYRQNDS